MKIGIITINDKSNYGNRLQNYAVQKTLKNMGMQVETVTKISEGKFGILKFKLKCIVGYIYNIIGFVNIAKLNQYLKGAKFEIFTRKYIKESKVIINNNNNTPKNIADMYDYFICGSDQVWNPNFSFNSEVEFLTFAKNGQRIAYSPSFGVSQIPDEFKERYREWINKFDYLSVREFAGAKIIKELTNREATVLVDPTLMLSKEEWLSIAKKPRWKSNGKYILTYFLGDKENKKIIKIAKENDLEVINLLDITNKKISSVDPSEFIWLINNSELMCTDSFHGVVFSLIMKTPFIVFERKDKEVSMNSRLETLLSLFNMESRINKNVSDNNIFNVHFDKVDKIIEDERNRAIKYLKNSLGIK